MDYIKLADMLFPNVDLTVDECLNAYPKRILPKGAEVVRIAPSPTGYLHIGSVYGAFIDKLIAYHSNGVYYMRLEDTDSKREIDSAGDIAYDMLCKFGLKPDEGYAGSNRPQVGEYGDYVQSNRQKIYLAFAKHLVALGKAYPCFCKSAGGKEEILKRRQDELDKTNDIEEKDVCRYLSLEQIENNLKQNIPFAIRLKSNGDPNKTFKVKDLIKGEREIRENSKDIVILKSNLTPPYSLAHVVDDTLMGTTLVVRGEEWFPSLSSHIELFKAFSLQPPKYAHTPVVCKIDEDGNKRKLSKRKDKEADTRYFIEKGYPISSVMEYLLNLINSDFEDWRRNNKDKSLYDFPFKVSKIGSNNPMFDFQKLNDCSKQVISRFSNLDIYNGCLSWAQEYSKNFYEFLKDNRQYCLDLFNIDRQGKNPRKDIAMWSEVYSLYDYMFDDLDKKTLDDYQLDDNIDRTDAKNILTEYSKIYNASDDKQVWFDKIKTISAKFGFADNMKDYKLNPQNYKGSVADISGLIRVAVTTRKNTPDLYYLMQLLGEQNVEKRIKQLVEKLNI